VSRRQYITEKCDRCGESFTQDVSIDPDDVVVRRIFVKEAHLVVDGKTNELADDLCEKCIDDLLKNLDKFMQEKIRERT
jgi:hypothetical protein